MAKWSHKGTQPTNKNPRYTNVSLAPKNLALLLQQSRVSVHMSQADLAQHINEPVAVIQNLERGTIRFPRPQLVAKLSEALGVDLQREL